MKFKTAAHQWEINICQLGSLLVPASFPLHFLSLQEVLLTKLPAVFGPLTFLSILPASSAGWGDCRRSWGNSNHSCCTEDLFKRGSLNHLLFFSKTSIFAGWWNKNRYQCLFFYPIHFSKKLKHTVNKENGTLNNFFFLKTLHYTLQGSFLFVMVSFGNL